ncbi:glycosyltransferase family 2 protein [Fibrobacter sp.]|uniref:glycosyltransferase family 2 protein n=1 Tax=Fibrobacter sp. TaxID=35828 RepID=UPI000A629B5E
MREKTIVLMSTYNGMPHLQEQVDSIFNQVYDGEIEIFVRDDGSKDDTMSFLEKYPKTELRRIYVQQGENIGPQKSFLKLIKNAGTADYYFFADQDDVWLPNKIERGVSSLRDAKNATVYCSNYTVTDESLNVRDEAFIKKMPLFTPIKTLLFNQVPGCCMAFNKSMMNLLKQVNVDNVMMHDSMLLSLASYIGSVKYDCRSSILHRIHGKNVVGEGHKKIILHKWIVEKIKLLVKKEPYDISKLADQFIRLDACGNQSLYQKDVELLRDYKKNYKKTIELLRHPDTHDIPWDRTTLSIRCKILFHLF